MAVMRIQWLRETQVQAAAALAVVALLVLWAFVIRRR
jgi:hypothetical protein